jgi:phosphohistidine swiveling domain-containing protein
MAVLLHGVVAVVAQHGGLLDHGAAMARELGLPCVVGCAGASGQIRAGDSLLVDGEAGLVLRLGAADEPVP